MKLCSLQFGIASPEASSTPAKKGELTRVLSLWEAVLILSEEAVEPTVVVKLEDSGWKRF